MIKIIFVGFAVILVVFFVLVSFQPGDFRTERSIIVAAAPTVVFEQVNDFHKWDQWSPWAKMDPAAKNSFEGPASGVGSMFSWDGNSQVGAGKMTVTEYRPGELLRFKMEFFKPFTGTNTAEFTFKPQGSDTLVTWAMYGPNSFVGKAMGLFMNCDKMVGDQFEKGLADIKRLSEAQARK